MNYCEDETDEYERIQKKLWIKSMKTMIQWVVVELSKIIMTILFTNECYLGKRGRSSLIVRGSYLFELIHTHKVALKEIVRRYNLSLQVLWDIRYGKRYSKKLSKFEPFELVNSAKLESLVNLEEEWMSLQEYTFPWLRLKIILKMRRI